MMKVSLNACLVALGLLSSSAAQSPHTTVQPIELTEAHWTGGFWKNRVDNCHNAMIPSMWEIMKGTHHKPFLKHFRIAAGLAEGRHRGAKWNDGDFYKWMEGVCAMLAVKPDPVWEQRLDEIIELIGKAQREDGYLHTPVLIGARNGDPNAKPFSDRFAFEMYNMGHLITAACVHHEVTGKDNFLTIAKRTAEFFHDTFHNPSGDEARQSICPSHYMGLIDLYRLTKDKRHLNLAKTLIGMRDIVAESGEGGDDNQDRLPFKKQTEVMGHAVRANYLYAGIADLYAETGDPALKTTLETLWQNLVEKKMYITGGCGALYDGASPDTSKDQTSMTRIHQAYGRNYQLPNTTAHNETCANIGNVLWSWRMFLLTGEARFIDVLELALYNSVLSGVSLEGSDYFYTNPLRVTNPLPVALRWSRKRVPFVTSYCCPPNVVRTVAATNRYAYTTSRDAIWVNLYGSSTANANGFRLRQETAYPWEGKITLTIESAPDKPTAIMLRIPGWASSAEVHANGKELPVTSSPGAYHELKRYWKAGDTIELDLAMPPILMESHPLVEETRNHVAIKRGPIVYCLESTDLPGNVNLTDVTILKDLKLTPRYDSQFLQGVTVLEGNVHTQQSKDWKGKLYRPLGEEEEPKSIQARFIPYYAWANRGESEMTVWLPLTGQ